MLPYYLITLPGDSRPGDSRPSLAAKKEVREKMRNCFIPFFCSLFFVLPHSMSDFFNRIRVFPFQEQRLCPRQILVKDLFLESSSNNTRSKKAICAGQYTHSFSNPAEKGNIDTASTLSLRPSIASACLARTLRLIITRPGTLVTYP